MSENKNCSKEEKITHLLSGELSEFDKSQIEKEIANDPLLKAEKDETEKLIAILTAHRDQFEYKDGIGANRKDKIFIASHESDKKITPIYFQPIFLAAATIIFGLGVYYLSTMKNDESVKQVNKGVAEVYGVKSFNMAMPSGTYYFTLNNGVLIMDHLEPLNGNDYLKESGLQKGDQIISLNDLMMEKFRMDEWRDIITSQIENQKVVLKFKRNGETITFSNKK